MIKNGTIAIVVALMVSFSLSASAEEPGYNYVELSYIRVDADGGLKPDGFGVLGSVELGDDFFLEGSYAEIEDDYHGVDVEFEELALGVGWRMGLGDNSTFHTVASYIDSEVEASGIGSKSDDGFGIELGLRSNLTKNIELNGGVAYVDVGSADGAAASIGTLYRFTQNVGVSATIGVNDDSDKLYTLGMRLMF